MRSVNLRFTYLLAYFIYASNWLSLTVNHPLSLSNGIAWFLVCARLVFAHALYRLAGWCLHDSCVFRISGRAGRRSPV